MSENEEDAAEDRCCKSEEEAAAARGRRASAAAGPSTRTRRACAVERGERALIEGGEGVEEGFEIAEDDLVEAATHGENRYDPSAADFGDEESAGDADVDRRARPTRSTCPTGPTTPTTSSEHN